MDLAWCSAHGSIAQNTAINNTGLPPREPPRRCPVCQGARRQRRGHRVAHTGGGQAPPLRKAAWLGAHSALSGPGRGRRSPGNGTRCRRPSGTRSRCAKLREQTREAEWAQVWDSGRARSDRWSRWAPPAARVCRRPRLPGLGSDAREAPAGPAPPRTGPMAAQAAAREAPILRLPPGAGPQAAGLVELEEEDEDEEVAAARRARSFARDARVRFVGCRLEQLLGLPEEKWSQHLESEDNRQVLGEFLESPSPACCLLFSVATEGQLEASHQVRGEGTRPHLASRLEDTRAGLASRASVGSFGTCVRAL